MILGERKRTMHCDGSLPLSKPLSFSPRLVLGGALRCDQGPAPGPSLPDTFVKAGSNTP